MNTTAYASSGDPNIDHGGSGLESGKTGNFWYSGDDGVRVTVVDSESGVPCSASIDYTNRNPSNIMIHFGKVCKADYLNGAPLSIDTGEYVYKVPKQALPTIVDNGSGTANIERIRSYFTDEQVVIGISKSYRNFIQEIDERRL